MEKLEGVHPSYAENNELYSILEMHVDLHLEEFEMHNAPKEVKLPYIVTLDEGSNEVLSIYRNYMII